MTPRYGVAISAVAISALFGAIYIAADHRSNGLAAKASSAMLQAMERGYNCHAAGRAIADCQQEQRERWASPNRDTLPPFGGRL